MTSDIPPLGLLLDVDGPIASPATRSIVVPSIAGDLVALAGAGVPVVFNTGRSDAFLAAEVVAPLVAAGLTERARVFGVCEKGAVWFRITPAGMGDLSIDESLVPSPELARAVDELVATRFAESMFFDYSKRSMISVEHRIESAADSDDYLVLQREFDQAVLDLCTTLDIGAMWRSVTRPASDGRVQLRLDPSNISTDIESVRVGKDLGAERALALIAATGPVPRLWRTMGDSRGDYAMADWLHDQHFDVAHVDVRPADGIPEKPYPVLTAGDLIDDEAGALFFARWRASVVDGRDAGGPA